jgi:uncharacterized transporter YbjL
MYLNLLFIYLMCLAITKNHFKNLKMFGKRFIIVYLQLVLGIHNLKSTHDTMG